MPSPHDVEIGGAADGPHRSPRDVLAEREERLQLALSAGRLGTWDLDLLTGERILSPRSAEIYGAPAEHLRERDAWASVIHPEDEAPVRAAFEALLSSDVRYDVEFRVLSGEEVRWVGSQAVVHRDAAGEPVRVVGIHRDITERKRIEQALRDALGRQDLLIHELNHRVKNTLATVQSIAAQTFRGEAASPEARTRFESRLVALSRAHDVLTRENWAGAELREVVAEAVAALRGGEEDGRVTAEGPTLRLQPRTAVALSMALHELGTNALKYGALLVPSGRVRVAWTVADAPAGGRALRLTWTEQGGPPVSLPARRGFGSRLIERGLAGDLGGTATLAFLPDGLTCTVEAVLPHPEPLSAPGSSPAAGYPAAVPADLLPRRRALVVEDEGLVAMLVEDMLLDMGWEVAAVATRLDDAVRAAGRDGIDVAVLDVNLGGTMSYPAADVLMGRGIPFVFASGYGRQGLDAAYRDVPTVSKPFDAASLRRALLHALGEGAEA